MNDLWKFEANNLAAIIIKLLDVLLISSLILFATDFGYYFSLYLKFRTQIKLTLNFRTVTFCMLYAFLTTREK